MEMTYELIEPLILRSEVEGSRMLCEFQLPGSNKTIESQATIRRSTSIKAQATRIVKRNLTNQLRRGASRALRQALGGGMVGRTGTTIFNSVSRDQAREFTHGYNDEERQAAIMDAFLKVSEHFHFDEETASWVQPPAAGLFAAASKSGSGSSARVTPTVKTEFEKQLETYPVRDAFEQEILSRILVEVANVDGEIGEDEKDFLEQFIGTGEEALNYLLVQEPLSEVECEEVHPKTRETIYMLAWVVSLIDMELDNAERNVLMEYGDMFGFDTATKVRLIMAAKHYALSNIITPSITREELFAYAKQIQLSTREAEKCLITMKRRM